MSDKERAISLLENVPNYKLGYVIAYLQGLTADEIADDEYCCHLVEEYVNSKDNDGVISFAEMVSKCGLDINEI